MNLHPVIVLLSVTVGGTLFNIIGAFLAVPVAAMIAVAFRYFQDITSLRAGEKTAEDINYISPFGPLAGRHSEGQGIQLRKDYYRSVLPQAKPEDAPLPDYRIPTPLEDPNEIRRTLLKKRLSTGKKFAAQTFDLLRRRK